jgi:penicillin-binding protein 1A
MARRLDQIGKAQPNDETNPGVRPFWKADRRERFGLEWRVELSGMGPQVEAASLGRAPGWFRRTRSQRRAQAARRVALGVGAFFLLAMIILALTAPLSKSLQPITAPSITLLSAEGRPIARRGSVVEAPVKVADLPLHVRAAFLAIEDRRFYNHLGIDPWGIARAGAANLRAGSVTEGGSTISQQLAKLAFLSSEQTLVRKVQEAILACWLEVWLDKDEIFSRYLSSVYFGDNVYGLRAAANHYFSRKPEELTVSEAAMLAGLVKAPSKLAPTSNFEGALERSRVVVNAMVEAGFLDPAAAADLPEVELKRGPVKDVPAGTYFADWVLSRIDRSEAHGQQRIRTSLEDRLQRLAAQSIRSVGTGGAQVALVAMRPDGRVVAMIGGRSYRQSPFNRATQAKRQPGSTFKIFVYLAALRRGYTPSSPIQDQPIRVGNWTPENYGGEYRGTITLRDAFAVSSNVAAVQLSERVGRGAVIRAARDLGIKSELEDTPTIALGTSNVSLIEMVSAFAAVARGGYPVEPHGLPDEDVSSGMPFEGDVRDNLLQLLWATANQGTGRAAALPAPTFGKTGTTQDNRDAYFIGFAGGLVTGVWIGRDDNGSLGEQAVGGGIPARIWRGFMAEAVKQAPQPAIIVEQADPNEPIGAEPLQEGVFISDYDVDESNAAPAGGEGAPYGVDPYGPPFDPAAGEPGFVEPEPVDPAAEEDPRDRGPTRREDVPILVPPPPPRDAEEPPEEGDDRS